uniref:Uncharacterized protein n=1 Tax=viral metagenome TaxID=1070528 RepID=A0A6M3LQD1_9ZZZZ
MNTQHRQRARASAILRRYIAQFRDFADVHGIELAQLAWDDASETLLRHTPAEHHPGAYAAVRRGIAAHAQSRNLQRAA